MYQLFTYAYALGSAPDSSRAGLIYPADSTSSGPNLRITPMTNVTSAQIRAEGLNVTAVLDDLAGRISRERKYLGKKHDSETRAASLSSNP